MEDKDIAGYSQALLDCSHAHRMIVACPIAFGEVGVKKRVRSVLNYRKPAVWIVAASLVLCIAAALCFLTDPVEGDSFEKLLQDSKEELTNEIGRLVSEAEAVRYSIEDWELKIDKIEGNRADCYFCANWISTRDAEDDPMIQGMYHAAEAITDQQKRKEALMIADAWSVEVESWPVEEYIEQPVVVLLENENTLSLYYHYVMGKDETLIPLEQFIRANWTEDSEKRFQSGVDIINGAVMTESGGR